MDLIQNKNLDEFMPKNLQQEYLEKGLKTFSEVLSKNQFEKIYNAVNLLNKNYIYRKDK